MMLIMKNGTAKIMTREQYLTQLFSIYSLVSVLSNKNDCKVLRVRNNFSQKDIVVRSFPKEFPAYEELYYITLNQKIYH